MLANPQFFASAPLNALFLHIKHIEFAEAFSVTWRLDYHADVAVVLLFVRGDAALQNDVHLVALVFLVEDGLASFESLEFCKFKKVYSLVLCQTLEITKVREQRLQQIIISHGRFNQVINLLIVSIVSQSGRLSILTFNHPQVFARKTI
jgi:hypothetical protein